MAKVRGNVVKKKKVARAKVHHCSKCGRPNHKAPTCTFTRRVGSPQPPKSMNAVIEEVVNTAEANAELVCNCPTCGTRFTDVQVFNALKQTSTE
tara:strand:- start:293 stop:574 length:282 start_codon:yes stop_codon:yes gene_type:complete